MSKITSVSRRLVLKWTPYGLYMRIYAWYAFWKGEPELQILSKLVDPQKESIDVGSNYGVYAYHLSRLTPRVHAYEPNPGLAARLCKAVPANVTVYEAGLSDEPGAASLHVPVYADGRHMHGCAKIVDGIAANDGIMHSVKLACLDDAEFMNIGFIKIDVEGHEEKVLRGAVRLLERCKPILLVEIEQRHLNKNAGEVIAYIESLGYRTFSLKGHCAVVRARWASHYSDALDPVLGYSGRELPDDRPINYIFIHRSHLSNDKMQAAAE